MGLRLLKAVIVLSALSGVLSEHHEVHPGPSHHHEHTTVAHDHTTRRHHNDNHTMDIDGDQHEDNHHHAEHGEEQGETQDQRLQCYHCLGTFAECGRKQRSDDHIRTCGSGQSCTLGRYGDRDDTYHYFRDCFERPCGMGMEELECMKSGTNFTCQLCCSSNHCNEDAFSGSTRIYATRHLFWMGLGVGVLAVLLGVVGK